MGTERLEALVTAGTPFSRLAKAIEDRDTSSEPKERPIPAYNYTTDEFNKQHRNKEAQFPGVDVNTDVAVWSSDECLKKPEAQRSTCSLPDRVESSFEVFTKAVRDKYEDAKREPRDLGDITPRVVLSRAFGVYDQTDGEFTVPWVYLASDDGSQVSFPASRLHASDRYHPTGRPWWIEAMENARASDVLVTSPYIDYSSYMSQSDSTIVRTIVHRFEVNDCPDRSGAKAPPCAPKKYVLGMDLLHEPLNSKRLGGAAEVAGRSSWDVLRNEFAPWNNWRRCLPPSGIVAALFALGCLGPWRRDTVWQLQRKIAVDAHTKVGSYKFTTGSRQVTSRASEWDIGGSWSKFFTVLFRRKHEESKELGEESEQHLDMSVDIEKEPLKRGDEMWTMTKATRARLARYGVVMERVRYAGTWNVRIEHLATRVPRITFFLRDGGKAEGIRHLEAAVRRSVHLGHSEFIESQASERPPSIDQAIPAVEEVQTIRRRISELEEGSFSFMDGMKFVEALYEKKKVRGVVRDYYLAELFKRNLLTVLNTGVSIDRTIVVEDKRSWAKISSEHRAELARLEEQTREGGGSVWVAFLDKLNPGIRSFRDKDFGLVDDNCVVVTEHYVVERSITSVEGIDLLRVHGYVSTRRWDVAFYEEFYRLISGQRVLLRDYWARTLEPPDGRGSSHAPLAE
ncbi:MAG TPA: hypothetical protein VFV19_18810 [Candidatus Polarisedimenticolaceae bacterium]|nr:hypothetical protein [Candidatus Polarisedimenticolaceae bacterium]